MRLSVQCFTLRTEFESGVDATLSELAAIGFKYAELAGYYGMSAGAFGAKLTEHGIRASGMHVGLSDLESNLERLLDEASELGCPHLILPWISDQDYADGWNIVAERVSPIAEAIHQAGKQFSYHNHAFEFAKQVDGRTGFDTFFDSASPLVGAETDVWWAYVGGEDPADLLRRHAIRTKLVHLKDGTAKDSDIHVAAGKGVLDWRSILDACNEIGVEYGVIELDNSPYSPLQAVRESCEFFRTMGVTD
jgi:sugar phosphate isomerase/epimerase